MNVRYVGMVMLERRVRVQVRVGFAERVVRSMSVLVVLIVHVTVVVLRRLVGV
jgi:hypothetical protein